MKNNFFSLNRFLYYFKLNVKLNLKDYLLALSVITLIIIALNFLNSLTTKTIGISYEEFNSYCYYIMLYLVGFHLAGISFSSFKDKNRISGLLTIPVSSFEKYISSLLINSILFFISFSVLYSLGTFIFFILSGSTHSFYNTFNDGSLFFSVLFFSLQSIFFAGSLFFKRYETLKTVLIILLVTVVIYFLNYILLYGIYFITNFTYNRLMFTPLYVNVYYAVYSVLFFIVLPVLCLIAGYFRLKEAEFI
ncbi:MAG TPA: hypothetical protein QF753_10950 [Victivallales bacterium]|nr:hypothetical protein [Victivallales bacterium]